MPRFAMPIYGAYVESFHNVWLMSETLEINTNETLYYMEKSALDKGKNDEEPAFRTKLSTGPMYSSRIYLYLLFVLHRYVNQLFSTPLIST